MPPDTAERRPRAESGAHDDGDDVSTRVTDLLALSDERDLWLARLLAAERAAYQRGLDDGRAAACVALAEMEEHYAEIAWWREWWAKVQRIIQAETDPSARMQQVMAEIAAGQKFARDARARLAAKPGLLTPLESAVVHRQVREARAARLRDVLGPCPPGAGAVSRDPDWPLIRQIIRIVHEVPSGGLHRTDLAGLVHLPPYGESMQTALSVAWKQRKIDFCGQYVVKPGTFRRAAP